MLLDLHNHTNIYSPCSVLEPASLVSYAEKAGLDGIMITEHHYIWTEEEVAHLKKMTGTKLIILRGQEIVTTIGDIIVIGCDVDFARHMNIDIVMEVVHDSGGIAVLAHPFRGNRDVGAGPDYLKKRFRPVDGIEVLNGNQTLAENEFALSVWPGIGIPGIGGSDAHSIGMVGKYYTFFENNITSEKDLVDEIKAGRCRPRASS